MNPVSKQCLFAGRQKFGSIIRGNIEPFGQTIDGITDTNLLGGGSHEGEEFQETVNGPDAATSSGTTIYVSTEAADAIAPDGSTAGSWSVIFNVSLPKVGIEAQQVAVWVHDDELPFAVLDLLLAIPALPLESDTPSGRNPQLLSAAPIHCPVRFV
jgi:hypothetical protein